MFIAFLHLMSHARSKVTNTAHAAVPWHANWCAMWVSITALLARAGSADDRSSPPSRRRERPSAAPRRFGNATARRIRGEHSRPRRRARMVSKAAVPFHGGTSGSNHLRSSGESGANLFSGTTPSMAVGNFANAGPAPAPGGSAAIPRSSPTVTRRRRREVIGLLYKTAREGNVSAQAQARGVDGPRRAPTRTGAAAYPVLSRIKFGEPVGTNLLKCPRWIVEGVAPQ